MKIFALAVALLSTSVAYARPSSSVSIGPVLSLPEIFGGQLSYWPDDDVSLDLRATLSSVEAGITGHIGISSTRDGSLWGNSSTRHDILVTAMGGFVHRGVRAGSYSDESFGRGGRVIGAVGYGYQGAVDLRILGGLSAYDATNWQLDPTFSVFLGWFI